MQKDKWNNTPLHYAVLSDGESQAAVISALMSSLSSTNILSLISQQNMWGYTPLHYVATFAPNAKEMIAFLCPSTITAAQKLQALCLTDQWQATPLSYAALYKSSVFFNRTFWTGITTQKKLEVLKKSKALPWQTQTTVNSTATRRSVASNAKPLVNWDSSNLNRTAVYWNGTYFDRGRINIVGTIDLPVAGEYFISGGMLVVDTLDLDAYSKIQVIIDSPLISCDEPVTLQVTGSVFVNNPMIIANQEHPYNSSTAYAYITPSVAILLSNNATTSVEGSSASLEPFSSFSYANVDSAFVDFQNKIYSGMATSDIIKFIGDGSHLLFTPKFEFTGIIVPTFLLAQ
jgi:hypothetical protein